MLGLYGIALLKELGINQVYCSGRQTLREPLIQEFGAIPMINREFELSTFLGINQCWLE